MQPPSQIPVIDFAGVRERDPAALRAAAQQVFAAATGVGFFYIINHGVPARVIEQALASAQAFFALPADRKLESKAVDHRGYIPVGNALMEGAARSDFKESFVIGLELDRNDPCVLAGEPLRGPNNWPAALPRFRDDLYAYFAAAAACGADLLRVVAVSLGCEPEFFTAKYRKPLQRMNVIHYPPMPAAAASDQFGGAAHTDYGCITLLWQDDKGGLQIQDRASGSWIDAAPVPDTLVINVGDLLERWSNSRFASNFHRVINRSGAERYSIATFFDPDFATIADPRDFGVAADEARFPPVGAGDYILGRVKRSFDYRAKG